MSLSTFVMSLALIALFVPGTSDFLSQDVFALKGDGVQTRSYGSVNSDVCGDRLCSEVQNDSIKSATPAVMKDDQAISNVPAIQNTIASDSQMLTEIKQTDGVGLEFSVLETINANILTPINARVLDTNNNANLSHTDWSYAVTNSNGKIIHKSTTLHGHFGIMNFQDSFPESGIYTVTYSILSSGPFMLGAPVPELGQTRSVITGDLLKFTEDPTNNFGARTFEFTINVDEPKQSIMIEGSEPNSAFLVTIDTVPKKIVVGEPVTIILDIDDYNTGKDATHVDGLISVIPQHYYKSDSGVQPDAPIPIPLHGAYHGHLGLLSVTQTFEKSGTVLLEVDLNTIPYSVPQFGVGSTQFTVQVYDSIDDNTSDVMMENDEKKAVVDIVGLSSPFYTPNLITISPGEKLIFDNVDGNHHTVTSVKSGSTEHDGKFDSGLLATGEKYELSLNKRGTYDYFCSLHAGMTGTIIIK